jgi:hypothetical protein
MALILREYRNEKTTFRQALHFLDQEICKNAKDRKTGSFIQVRGIIPFLVQLMKPEHIPQLENGLKIDYVTLTRTCNELCSLNR